MTAKVTASRWRSENGLTLIEMLVVLAIVSLVYVLAMPNFWSTRQSVGLRAIAFDMKMQLGAARAAAIASNRPVGVVIDLPKRRYVSEADGRWIGLPADLAVSVTTARDLAGRDEVRLVFFPDGSSTGGNVRLRRDNRSYEVGVDWLTGRTSVAALP